MRIGLVGAGPWARTVHGPGLKAADDIEFAGLWARDPAKAADLAGQLDVPTYGEYPALVDDVEAVAFAVPPDVQVGLALEAARAGRHLLLEKPVATSPDRARELAAEVDRQGVASVVFLTDRFSTAAAGWFEEVRRTGGWRGGSQVWLSALGEAGNPFGASPWRWERGALWDVGPHVLSTFSAALGPVAQVHAVPGAGDLVHLVLVHEGGATSTATLTLNAPAGAATHQLMLWGEAGVTTMPGRQPDTAVTSLSRAATELAEAARDGRPHPLDVHDGVRMVELLAAAEAQLK